MKRVAIGLATLTVILVVGVLVLYSSLGAIFTKAVNSQGPEIIQAKVKLDETVIDATSGNGVTDLVRGLFGKKVPEYQTLGY